MPDLSACGDRAKARTTEIKLCRDVAILLTQDLKRSLVLRNTPVAHTSSQSC